MFCMLGVLVGKHDEWAWLACGYGMHDRTGRAGGSLSRFLVHCCERKQIRYNEQTWSVKVFCMT